MARTSHPLGIDIGGSGIKGAPVDLAKGAFTTERLRIDTPEKSTPENVAEVVKQIADHFADQTGDSPIGITIPAVVQHGIVRSAANIDKSWIDTDADTLFSKVVGRDVTMINDADAVGVAELNYGAAKGVEGVVLCLTLGTGIGSALLNNGVLVPNTELGHVELDGHDAETRASSGAKEKGDLSWKEYIPRLQRYLSHIEALFSPDLIVIGGGISKKSDKFLPKLELKAKVVPAELLNDGGIVGAAWQATQRPS